MREVFIAPLPLSAAGAACGLLWLLTATCITTTALAQDEKTYSVMALSASAAAPRLCPDLKPNMAVVTAALIASGIDVKSEAVRRVGQRFATQLEERHRAMGHQPFCDLMWTAWGDKGAILPDVLTR